MEVRNCRRCGRLYNYIGGSYANICPDCIQKVEDKFQDVKEYIENNPKASMQQIAEDCEVGTKQLEQWIREERLTFADDSPVGIACENCGAMIKSGRYCDMCKSAMTNQLNSIYGKPKAQAQPKYKPDKTNPKMRYFDK